MPAIILPEELYGYIDRNDPVFARGECRIIGSSSKEEILQLHSREPADVLVVDIDMPVMTLEKFCAHVRMNEKLNRTAIVAISPSSRHELDRCLACGVDALISRTASGEEIHRTLLQVLNLPARKDVRVLMRISVTGRARSTFFATSENISTSGMRIGTAMRLSAGDTVELSFYLRMNRLFIDGEVVWAKQKRDNFFEYGIKFTAIDKKSRQLIEDFIRIHRQTGRL